MPRLTPEEVELHTRPSQAGLAHAAQAHRPW